MKMIALKMLGIGLLMMVMQVAIGQVIVVGNPPAWGPVGYTEVRYYYIPDVHSYYDISTSRFIYYENSKWIRSAYLPAQYRSYDLYRGYKQPIRGYKGNSPYIFYPAYKIKYKPDYRAGQQVSIGPKPGNSGKGMVIGNGGNGSKGHQGSGHPKGFPNNPKISPSNGHPSNGKPAIIYPKGNNGSHGGGNGSKGGNGHGGGNSGGNGGGSKGGGKGK